MSRPSSIVIIKPCYDCREPNSNAYDRSIVLHANTCIPEQETHPDQICNSQGCTTVAAGAEMEAELLIVLLLVDTQPFESVNIMV